MQHVLYKERNREIPAPKQRFTHTHTLDKYTLNHLYTNNNIGREREREKETTTITATKASKQTCMSMLCWELSVEDWKWKKNNNVHRHTYRSGNDNNKCRRFGDYGYVNMLYDDWRLLLCCVSVFFLSVCCVCLSAELLLLLCYS